MINATTLSAARVQGPEHSTDKSLRDQAPDRCSWLHAAGYGLTVSGRPPYAPFAGWLTRSELSCGSGACSNVPGMISTSLVWTPVQLAYPQRMEIEVRPRRTAVLEL